MRDPTLQTRKDALKSQEPADDIEMPYPQQTKVAEALSLKSAALVAVPAAVLLAVGAASIYSTVALTNLLTDLRSSVDLLVDQRTKAAAIEHDSRPEVLTTDAGSSETAGDGNPDLQHFEQIEAQLSELNKSLNLLASKVNQPPAPMTAASAMVPPPLPSMSPPPFAQGTEAEPMAEPSQHEGITEELRSEANEILRDYAEQARLEIQAQQEAGLLDRAAMQRIKTETRLQAANALENRLPADVYEEMFPTVSAGPGM